MRIAVVGDVLLDVDVEGAATRLSPDGPVPVVDVESRASRAGGAGLVAALLARDGHDVELVTALGDDEEARLIRRRLADVSIATAGAPARTPVKTRLRANGATVARVDEHCGDSAAPPVSPRMLEAIASAEAIVVADYGRGLAARPEVREALERRGGEAPLVWDPHPRGPRPVAAARLVTPNLSEAARATGLPARPDAAPDAAARLLAQWGCRAVAVTLGEHGALVRDGREDAVPVRTRPVPASDPCGAGDRFASSAAVALAGGSGAVDAVREAVAAASAFLAAGGVSALPAPHRAAPAPVASAGRRDARAIVEATRALGGVVVATGGCFDLLHAGHLRTLAAARELGDCLVVCLNSDASVSRLKGDGRPIVGERDRAELLAALECVDAVAVFDEDTPEALVRELRPDVWVKGGDYRADDLPEAALVRSWGGRALTLPFHLGRSTSSLASALARVG